MSAAPAAQLDHLVIAARTLSEGVAWCEATLGVVPAPGGEHALFGTHNRLLRLACEWAPRAYLEIIAVNPQATPTPTRPAGLRRWFDLDDPGPASATLAARATTGALGGPRARHRRGDPPPERPRH